MVYLSFLYYLWFDFVICLKVTNQMHRKLFPFWAPYNMVPLKFSCPEELFHCLQFSFYLFSFSLLYLFLLYLYDNFAMNSLGNLQLNSSFSSSSYCLTSLAFFPIYLLLLYFSSIVLGIYFSLWFFFC